MADTVTAAQLADELGVSSGRLQKWLRDQKTAGHPLLAAKAQFGAWLFPREHADQLAEEFEAAEAEGHVSDSAVQRRAEAVIRELLSERLGVPLTPRTIKLQAGAPVQVDAASVDGTVLAEIFARQGALKGGQQKKVAIDTLKLITIHREQPAKQLVICFADKEAAAYATGGGWVAQAVRTWGVDVEVVDIPADLRAEIVAAQAGQTMVNPS
jgi:hypothetical protein